MTSFIKTVAMVAPGFAPTAQSGLDAYILGDAIPAPEVIEKNSDSVWALWADVLQEQTVTQPDAHPAAQLMGLDEPPKNPQA